MSLSRYHLAALTSSLIFGFFPIPLRLLGDYPSGQILFFRVLLSLVLLIVLHVIGRRAEVRRTWQQWQAAPRAERRRVGGSAVLSGMLLATNWLAFIYVLNHVSVQAGSFAYLICPVITTLLGFSLLGEKLKPIQWLAIGVSLLGCAMLGSGALRPFLMGLGIATTWGFYLITQRQLKSYDSLVLLTVQLAVAATIIFPLASVLEVNPAAGFADSHFMLVMVLLSLGFTVLPLFLNMTALGVLPSGTVGVLLYASPLTSFLLAFLYFGEQAAPAELLAYAVILASIVLYSAPDSWGRLSLRIGRLLWLPVRGRS
ncbi:EamA family transporter [Hymenobacter sp. BT175]|uniref:EamA family transporter n=1 Tax=Hymenobacter translucens TaxID=2886507 RepID=UPI001D0F367E|nr:EamA family transporter [Hymenobacter translucens]MCC2546091.1 EamA family transporter [Hymenobacter translucens]